MRNQLFLVLLLLAGCDCGRGRLVAANGGTLRVTLIGADVEALQLGIQLFDGLQPREQTVPITALPMVTTIDELPSGNYRAVFTAWDVQPTAIRSVEMPELFVGAGAVTEVTIDLARGRVTPAERCDGVDNDGDGEIDEALDLPVCVSCRAGQPTVLGDDERCGVIACDGLDSFELRGDNTASGQSSCVRLEHAPLTAGRCVGSGACLAPNGPACGEATERVVSQAELCQTLEGCEAGQPMVVTAADGTPCGGTNVCRAGVCVGVTMADRVGCADGTREGFQSQASYPGIAACSGAWSVPGVTPNVAPACGRGAGNTSANREGSGCAASDLCSAGWHVCRGKDEVALRANGSCADAVPPGATNNSLFFAVSQASVSNTACDTSGDNDVFGCGNLGTQLGAGKNCGVLTRALASTRPGTCGFNEAEPNLGPWQCMGGTQGDLHEGALVTKMGCPNGSCSYDGAQVGNSDKGGVLCCLD